MAIALLSGLNLDAFMPVLELNRKQLEGNIIEEDGFLFFHKRRARLGDGMNSGSVKVGLRSHEFPLG